MASSSLLFSLATVCDLSRPTVLLKSLVCREVLVECESLLFPLPVGTPLMLRELLALSLSLMLLALLFMRKKLRRRLLTGPPAEVLAGFDGIVGWSDRMTAAIERGESNSKEEGEMKMKMKMRRSRKMKTG